MDLPEIELSEWEDSRLKWQLLCQIAGKVRLKLHPPMNHWWHVTLYLSPHGLTTGDIPFGGGLFSIELDLETHRIRVSATGSREVEIQLDDRPIAELYHELFSTLRQLGVEVKVVATPYKCKSQNPFAEDLTHTAWDKGAVTRAWRILAQIEPVFKEFRSRYLGKASPVHLFWHSFDLAASRFSGRPAPPMPAADAVTREAYSHEVNSAGFWFGDDTLPEAAFYCYTAPAPAGLAERPLRPSFASWQELYGSPMAVMLYRDWRESPDPRASLLDFLHSAYEAGAIAADWDRQALERA